MNVGGIVSKLEKNAELVTAGISVYQRFGNISDSINHFTSMDVFTEVQRTFTEKGLLKFKLLDSPHLYSGLFKIGAALYVGKELGIVPARWGKIGEKVAIGSGVSAILLPGSDHSGCRPYENNTSPGSLKDVEVIAR